MMTTRIGTRMVRACLGIGLAWLSGCDGGDEPRTVTVDDAQAMTMPGNATGMSFSGTYATTTSSIDGCRCRSGTCASFHPVTGGITVAVQNDGTLMLDDDCVGGVNSDGAFWCGGSTSGFGNTQIAINTGTFMMSGGKPTGLQATAEITIVGLIDGQNHDCDLRGHATARFVAP